MEIPQTLRNPTREQWNFQSKSHSCCALMGFRLEISLFTRGISFCLRKFRSVIVGFLIKLIVMKVVSEMNILHCDENHLWYDHRFDWNLQFWWEFIMLIKNHHYSTFDEDSSLRWKFIIIMKFQHGVKN